MAAEATAEAAMAVGWVEAERAEEVTEAARAAARAAVERVEGASPRSG